jgi:dTDP-4-dehydrorhamnose reductase
MTRLLVIGGSGQLGIELTRAALPAGLRLSAPARAMLDLTNASAVGALVAAQRPDIIINASGYTAVDKAESEPDLAFALNRDGPGALAGAAAAVDAALVHVSTDYVFAGDGDRAYIETDPKAPLGVYGRSKAEGEDAVLAAGGRAAILRTSWVFSAHRANFVKTMLRLGETRDEIGVVADQHGRPTSARDLAQACLALAQRLHEHDARAEGVFHFANTDDTSWADFAETILAGAAQRGRKSVRVNRISTEDYPTPARRPANSRLDTNKISALLGAAPRPWRTALDECLDELLA